MFLHSCHSEVAYISPPFESGLAWDCFDQWGIEKVTFSNYKPSLRVSILVFWISEPLLIKSNHPEG